MASTLKFNTFVSSISHFDSLTSSSIREVIIEHEMLGRLGALKTNEVKALIEQAVLQNFTPVLQWDILCTDRQIQKGCNILKQLPLSKIAAVRVQDLGVAEVIRQNYPKLPIHLIVETGNHNLAALKKWAEYFKNQLQRFVLSTEIPFSTINQYCQELKIPCEILGLGKILLFYTPRKLLSPFGSESFSTIEKIVSSDEQQHHAFSTIENQHGTFMFHYYDLFLIDMLPELLSSELEVLRLDFRFLNSLEKFELLWIQPIETLLVNFDTTIAQQLKSKWPTKTTHGFFRANRTDRPIERLKNKHLRNHGDTLVAYVVESVKQQHIAVISRQSLSINEPLLFITPEGKELTIVPSTIRSTTGEEVESTEVSGVWLLPYHKWIVPKTLVYRIPSSTAA